MPLAPFLAPVCADKDHLIGLLAGRGRHAGVPIEQRRDTWNRWRESVRVNDIVQNVARSAGKRPVRHYVDLDGADLECADISGFDLSGASMFSAKLYQAQMVGTQLSDANLHSAEISRAMLDRAVLIGTDLSDADLSFSYIRQATFADTDLSYANLLRADLSNPVFETRGRSAYHNVTLDNAKLTLAKIDGWQELGFKTYAGLWLRTKG